MTSYEQVDTLGFLARQGKHPKRVGGENANFTCWFCNEDPSRPGRLYVNVADDDRNGLYWCHKCGESGNAVTMWRHFGEELTEAKDSNKPASMIPLMQAACTFYEESLTDEVVSYLTGPERSLNEESIKRFRLGWAPGGHSLYKHLVEEGFDREHIKQSGLVVKRGDRFEDFFQRQVIIPYLSHGTAITLRGKEIGGKYRSLPRAGNRLFNAEAAHNVDEVIVTEGEFDCILMEALGFHAVAAPGAQTFEQGWENLFETAQRVYLMYDPDSAGVKGVERVKKRLQRAEAVSLPIPPGVTDPSKVDPSFLVGSHGWTAEHFSQLVSEVRRATSLLVSPLDAFREWEELQDAGGLRVGWPMFDSAIKPGLLPGQVVIPLAKTNCLAGATEVVVNRGGASRRMRLDVLVAKFHGTNKGEKWDPSIPTSIQHVAKDGTVRLTLIRDAFRSGERETYELSTRGGRRIRATAKHRFMTRDGWKRLGELNVGDLVLVNAGHSTANVLENVAYDVIESLTFHGIEETYDISVDAPHNFMANGFVVHNSGKSIMLLNAMHSMAMLHPDSTAMLFLSLEQTRAEWFERARRIWNFYNLDCEPGAVNQETLNYWDPRFRIVDRNRLSANQTTEVIREFKREIAGDRQVFVCLDYLGYFARSFEGSQYEKTTNAVMYVKEIAKEERVVIMAPHQVSRGAEHGAEFSLDSARDSVTGDTRVLCADGRWERIDKLVGSTPSVGTITSEGRFRTARTERVWQKTERDIIAVATQSGRVIRGTHEHPVMTSDGRMKFLSDVTVDDSLMIAERGVFGSNPVPEAELVGEKLAESPERTVPAVIFEADKPSVAAFLRGLFSCGGYLAGGEVRLDSTSETLAREVQHLLTRFGIRSSSSSAWGGHVLMWRLVVKQWASVDTFRSEIGFSSDRKAVALAALLERRSNQFSADLHLATNDLYPDPVVSVRHEPAETVYDLSIVGGPHVFFANDVLVSNSGAVEETADFSMAVWNPDTLQGNDHGQRTGRIQMKLQKSRHGGKGRDFDFQFGYLSLVMVPKENVVEAGMARAEVAWDDSNIPWQEAMNAHRTGIPPHGFNRMPTGGVAL